MHYIKGSNYIWQVDSYDKIKNCEICINNCIVGYSKKNDWCKVTYSRGYFHLALLHDILLVKEYKIHMSQKVGRDRGAENKDLCIQYCIPK